MKDQGKCLVIYNDSCYLANSQLNSSGNFENKCYRIKSSLYNESYCSNVFSGKYFEGNLYSIDLSYDNNFTYDCDGEGDKTFDLSLYNPKESWEITNKERYDCIYSETPSGLIQWEEEELLNFNSFFIISGFSGLTSSFFSSLYKPENILSVSNPLNLSANLLVIS